MPPQGEKNISPEISPEKVNPDVAATPEKAVTPEVPKEPGKETFADTPIAPVIPEPQTTPAQTTAPAADDPDPQGDEKEVSEMDNVWVHATNQVIEKNKDKPYEEEEEAEKLQIKYLFKRFGKLLKKDKGK